ncbi:uncharacterized protein LOC128546151 isoform X1 [Mercenaria mercenaria]|uniref:uncharacterized protein LOC128546151 isoform X1 n=1 Tax=Mercenaria mercenaria TaxID=6596 RepID=UPI00234FAE9D|nr:uncharacterized protein LOC128546151 isoform X1 [Mercenaria mercenaria]
MMHIKPVPLLDPHTARNQCKLIWDSAAGPRNTLPVKKKVGFVSESSQTVASSFSQSRYPRRNSLVATRISFYEDRTETIPSEEIPDTESKVQVKISFDDHATTTFEYEGEEAALETYLEEHPDEKEEAESVNIVNGVTETSDAHLMNDSPAVPLEPETHMKSNTVLGTSGGGLTSYKSKIQTQDFQFGMSPEPEVTYSMPELEQEEPESIDLLPADDNELDAFSAEVDKADMLF